MLKVKLIIMIMIIIIITKTPKSKGSKTFRLYGNYDRPPTRPTDRQSPWRVSLPIIKIVAWTQGGQTSLIM